jgi:hypothetical protein
LQATSSFEERAQMMWGEFNADNKPSNTAKVIRRQILQIQGKRISSF